MMVVDETSTYTNTSGVDKSIEPIGFDFQVGSNRGRVTPFLVKVNGDNDFTVVAIGQTRISGVDYNSEGVIEFSFGNAPAAIILGDGETLAAGLINANDDGSENAGSVVPFFNSTNEIWLSGGPNPSNSGSIALGNSPTPGTNVITSLNRTYAWAIDVIISDAGNTPPSDIVYSGEQPLPGMMVGTRLGSFTSVDSDSMSHTYTLVSNPVGLYAVNGNHLEIASSPANAGTSSTIQVRSTDSEGNIFEKNFTLIVDSQSPPTGIELDASSLSALADSGAPVALMSALDTNSGDQFSYSLVSGAGDGDNGLFSIAGDVLSLSTSIPTGQNQVSFRLRVTDLAGSSFERSFTLPVILPLVKLNEFSASNSSLADEDGETSDWIEIFNSGSSCVDLENWTISDDLGNSSRWTFPPTTLAPGEYLIIFASGKDRAVSGSELHTNFGLNSSGETLSLYAPGDLNLVSQFTSPPEQFGDITYGFDPVTGLPGYMMPTPMAVNSSAFSEASEEVEFSHLRGAYSTAFNLTLSTTGGAQIRYTLDGSKPTASSLLYTGPINITAPTTGSRSGLRTIRAAAFSANALLRPIETHTYLFAADAANQSDLTSSITNHSTYGSLIESSMTAHPVISITLPTRNLPNGTEAEASLEFFDPNQANEQFQIDCGIRVVGGHSVNSQKNNFRLFFRSEYGESKLRYPLFENHPYSTGATDVFDRLNLRSGSHDTFFWLANPANPPNSGGPVKGDALYVRNRWMSDMQFRMGHPSLHGQWVQVFINGNYRGQYHLMEHPNQDFQASYLGGDEEDYEFSNGANPSKTGSDNWQASWSQVQTASNSTGAVASEWIDLENLADYMILSYYAGNPWDWNPNQNWWTAGPNQAGAGGWKFFAWDTDIIFQDPGANVLSKNVPDGIFSNLIDDPDFATVFRDRLYKHCFNDGLLEPENAQLVFDVRASEIELSIVAETARWQNSSVANAPWDRDGEWLNELNRMRNSFFPTRCNTLLNQIRARGWYPVEAPEFGQRGGLVSSGFDPALTAPTGSIYYTTDGSDPRLSGGSLSPAASVYSPGSLSLTEATLVRARVRNGNEWSAINEAAFVLSGTIPADVSNLAITELHYHPADPSAAEIALGFDDDDDFEFIELTNFSNQTIDLTDLSFSLGVSFNFPSATILSPGERTLVVRNTSAFLSRHPALSSMIAGEFSSPSGNPDDERLSNSGERLVLLAADGSTIVDLTWDDKLPWPNEADGDGYSMVLRSAPSDATDPASWRSSSTIDGNPGASDSIPFFSGVNPVNYALADPNLGIRFTSAGNVEISYVENLQADDVDLVLERSSDLVSWQSTDTTFEIDDRDNNGDGTISITFKSLSPPTEDKLFFRLKITVR